MTAPLRSAACLGIAASLLLGCHKSSSRSTAELAAAAGETPVVTQHLDQDEILTGAIPMEAVLQHGKDLFVANFNSLDGAGRPSTTGTGASRGERAAPQNFNRISGPDSNSCAGCHRQPFVGGAGDNVANVFVMAERLPFVNFDGGAGDNFQNHTLKNVGNERNTVGVFGAGYIELLAREMTRDLHNIRDKALADAKAAGKAVTLDLKAKGVSFGKITANANGLLDTADVEGVDSDLIIKPFHQKGVVISLRQFTNNGMNQHHGMQSVERFGKDTDPDGDDVSDELSIGDLTAITLFQATLPAPGQRLPGSSGAEFDAVKKGETLFSKIGCATCHVTEMRLESPMFVEPNPYNPAGNLQTQPGQELRVDLTKVGDGPFLKREPDGSVIIRAFTDLKRHDMGPELGNEELVQNGVPTSHFITRKLWGVASEAPFLHHGRALTLREAIVKHGGDSKTSREEYEKLSAADQQAIVEFLKTLVIPTPGSAATDTVGAPSGTIGEEPTIKTHLDQKDIDNDKLTAEALFAHGEKLFEANFNTLDGAGRPLTAGTGAVRAFRSFPENFNRISGPDANSCAGCHNQPRSGGGGDNVANVFVLAQGQEHVNFDGGEGDGSVNHDLDNVGNERNTLGMWGSGFVELLAREMTKELLEIREAAKLTAQKEDRSIQVPLTTKGVTFGNLIALPDGRFDISQVEGIDDDLIVRPFHQKGVVVSLREFTNNAMNHHHGMQPQERFGKDFDADFDGVVNELTPGDMTAITLFQAMLAVPERVLPKDGKLRASVLRGERLFEDIGCAHCHTPGLVLDDPIYTEPNPYNKEKNLRLEDVTKPFAVDLTVAGQKPRLDRRTDGKVVVPLYSDLKRHHLGPDCDNEKQKQNGVDTGSFITRKLWGMASEPPFLHHGRASTLTEAIQAHGGEAAVSRSGFRALAPEEQASIIDFLKTLQVMPK